jgi:FKBP-type peptidyl-prolyl cis-trans isomerase
MQVNGERLLIIPPNLGYGKKKTGNIPPNSTLTFGMFNNPLHLYTPIANVF